MVVSLATPLLQGLASLYLNEDRVAEALAILKRAFLLEPDNPAVLNHLANHHFYRCLKSL